MPSSVAPGAGAVLTGIGFMAALLLLADHHTLGMLVDDGGQLAAASIAAVACAVTARRSPVIAARRPWMLLSAGLGCWALGQLAWSVYEIGLGREAPFPSIADVGFLMLPVVASFGLLRWLHDDRAATRARDLLDGAVIAGSLMALSWATTLGSIRTAGEQSALGLAILVAYPVTDVMMATFVLLTLARTRRGRRHAQALVAAGMGGLAFADSAYLYLTNAGTYSSGNIISAGWLTGFLLIAAGARVSLRAPTAAPSRAEPTAAEIPLSLGMTLLPYLPLVLAEVTVVVRLLQVRDLPLVDLSFGAGLAALVLGRQFVVMIENRRLLVALARARDQLRHQALHDPLTGLANRVLFTDRLQHALALRSDGAGVAVLFCDVDDFKGVNDALGHGGGDAVLRLIADRLRRVLSPVDTAARLGGDEFAVLLENAPEPQDVAQRLVEAVALPCQINGSTLTVTLSIGLAEATPTSADSSAEAVARPWPHADDPIDVLRHADSAMYAAKAAGKGRVVRFDDRALVGQQREAPAVPAARSPLETLPV